MVLRRCTASWGRGVYPPWRSSSALSSLQWAPNPRPGARHGGPTSLVDLPRRMSRLPLCGFLLARSCAHGKGSSADQESRLWLLCGIAQLSRKQ